MLLAAAAAVLVALTPQTASANGCSPTTSTGSPLLSTTVTCTSTTLNQNNPSGFGSGHESNVIVNVASGATVQGSFNGINLGNDNTISNAGTISDSGNNPSEFFGVTTTGAILGTSSDPNSNITLVLSQTSIAARNDGTISATASGSITTAFQATVRRQTNLDAKVDSSEYPDHQLPLSPHLTLSTKADYKTAFWEGILDFQFSANFKSRQFFDVANSPFLTQNAYWLENARIAYSFDDDRWEAAAFVRNLSGQKYFIDIFDLSFVGIYQGIMGRPRMFGAEANYRF